MNNKNNLTHAPKPCGLGGFTFMKSLCGGNSVSSALNTEWVTCDKCLNLLSDNQEEIKS